MAAPSAFDPRDSLAKPAVNGTLSGVSNYTGPASYATGGFSIDLVTDENLNNAPYKVDVKVILTSSGAPDAANYAEWDYTNNKAVVFVRTTGAQLAAAQDLSARTLRVEWEASQG